MRLLFLVLYNAIAVPLLFLGSRVLSIFNPKIQKGLQGRKKTQSNIKIDLTVSQNRPRILIHVSSYGEFLQVKPVLSQLKRLKPQIFIIISFFSPSGFEHVSVAPPIDLKCYLPFDSYFQVKKFVAAIAPKVVVIVRHDIWPNFVSHACREKIPLILINASIPQNSSRFLPILKQINRYLFSFIRAILAISDTEAARLSLLIDDPEKISVIGDTKYDQVFERSQHLDRISHLLKEPKIKQQNIFVVGSSWQTDEEFIIPAFQQLRQKFVDLIMILAPHEPTPGRVEQIERRLEQAGLKSLRLSQFTPGQFDHHCLIIDQIGMLANIYYLGKIAFVGGSFHYKIHNVLEPAVYGISILFGPKITNSVEAQHLLTHQAAFLVNSIPDIVRIISDLLVHPEHARIYGERARQIVMQNVGSSEKIAKFLLPYLE